MPETRWVCLKPQIDVTVGISMTHKNNGSFLKRVVQVFSAYSIASNADSHPVSNTSGSNTQSCEVLFS